MSDKRDENRTKKEKDPIGIFYMIRKTYPMVFRANPGYYIFNQTLSVFHGISIGVNVLVTQFFFDAVFDASGMSDRAAAIRAVAIGLAVFAACKIIQETLNAVHNFTTSQQFVRVRGHMQLEINNQSALIDPVEYENPKRLDDIEKAGNGLDTAIMFHFTTSTLLTFYTPYFIFMGIYLTSLQPALLFSLLFIFVPVLIAQVLRSAVFSKLEDESAPLRREFGAYQDAASGRGFLKETRLLGAFAHLKGLLDASVRSLNAAVWKANKRSALIDLGFNTLSLMGYGGILWLLVHYLLNGDISVGAFAAVFGSIGLMFAIMEEIIRSHIGNIADNFGQIRNFLRFLEIQSDNRPSVELISDSAIVLSDVTFRYPNAEKDSLRNINLAVNAGETIAIVGENGAGKTTLVKLLTGLYKPTEGSVKIGGHDTNDVNYKSLFENLSGVFQKYQRYALNLRENIAISDFAAGQNQAKTERILHENNVDKDDKDVFPDGLDTMLSREFDGVELSGGQWQRVAIARGFYRDSHLIVLDEPTAAIDPIEESAIYKKFVEASRGKTAIVVTHRLGSARIAEKIIVMQEGEIAETGSHDELMQSGGEYARMYASQSDWYDGEA